MPIISKETWTPWELIPKEAQDSLISDYKALLTSPNKKEREWARGFEMIFGKENLQHQLTYEDVARELFGSKKFMTVECHFTSYQQAEKLLAINKLLNVAKFLSKDWKPDWENRNELKFGIGLLDGKIKIEPVAIYNLSIVYFRTEELAKQAIQILGEDTVRLALTTEY